MTKLKFKLDYSNPIQVDDFCGSLSAFAAEYRRQQPESVVEEAGELDLFISEIREGSIEAMLVQMAPYAMLAMESYNTFYDFVCNFRESVEWLRGGKVKKPTFDLDQLDNISRILKPVSADVKASLCIDGDFKNYGVFNYIVNSPDATHARANAMRELQEMSRPRYDFQQKVVLRWYQARNDVKSKSGDRAIIDSISKSSLKAVFQNEGVKAKMLSGDENPFLFQYVVDVLVEYIGERPRQYRILDCAGRVV